jgi:ABC-type Fe3+-hydroxamate transport system substrate-binding protein
MTTPRRIVCLVPSLTELAWWLGAGDRLVGRTRFCVEPAREIDRIPAIGGTKDPDVARVIALEPDLIIANREENRREDVEALQKAGIRVLLTDPVTVIEAAVMVREVGDILGCEDRAAGLADELESLPGAAPAGGPRVFVPIWRRPLMGLGSGTFGEDILRCAGGVNVLSERERYPEVTIEEIRGLGPDLVLLPDEPFRFREKHVPEFAAAAPARLVRGQDLFWYGPRTPAAIRRLRRMFGTG